MDTAVQEVNKGGRPLAYQPDELYDKFIQYKAKCIQEEIVVTVSGFCIDADIVRETYYTYRDDSRFMDIIKKIESEMEEHVIQKAYTMRNPAFPIFHLKNKFGWADKQEITNNVNITLSADERVARIAELQRKAQLRAGAIEAEIIEIST